ncbi:MAG: hypothetical protein F6K39_16125 [Okeania sp. SIO3B3]|nr:hypothetical protein [Okeania sp. SIO3B3]
MNISKTKLKFEYRLPSGNVLTAENEYSFKEDEDIKLGLSKARELLAGTIANERPDMLSRCLEEMGVTYSAESLEKIRKKFYDLCKEIDLVKSSFFMAKDRLKFLEIKVKEAERLEAELEEKDILRQYLDLLEEVFSLSGTNDYMDYMSKYVRKNEPPESSPELEQENTPS